jgi:tRNA(fMet)-specific endonuclease VapC
VKLMLDTSAYAGLMKGDTSVVRVLSHSSSVFVPAIVLGELQSGFRRGTRYAENAELLERFLSKPSVRIAPISHETAVHYGQLDQFLREKGRPIPRNDVWIAASALENGCRLLTLDAHFREIPVLVLEPR